MSAPVTPLMLMDTTVSAKTCTTRIWPSAVKVAPPMKVKALLPAVPAFASMANRLMRSTKPAVFAGSTVKSVMVSRVPALAPECAACLYRKTSLPAPPVRLSAAAPPSIRLALALPEIRFDRPFRWH